MVCSFIEGNGAFVEVCKVLGTSEKPGLHAGTRATSCDASWLRFDLGWKNSPADQLTKKGRVKGKSRRNGCYLPLQYRSLSTFLY